MKEIAQIRKLSLWIFIIPLLGINLCLFITVNHHLLENTIFTVDQIGRSNFTFPYFDGGLSISRASRTFPAYLIFKPSMILTSILVYFYWSKNNKIINTFNSTSGKNYKFRTFGIISAICLAIHAVLLRVEIDIKIFKLFRRVVLLSFIIFEIAAQGLLVHSFYKLKDKILKDMLTGLPYTGLEQDGSLTVFYFDRTKFNFPAQHVESIKSGSYRNVPVLRIFDKNRNTLIVVADTPEKYWHSRNSSRVLYVPQHQFSPLIDFSVGGWSIQVAMETVDIQAVYEFILPVSEIESLSNVSLKFVNENDLRSFLDPIL